MQSSDINLLPSSSKNCRWCFSFDQKTLLYVVLTQNLQPHPSVRFFPPRLPLHNHTFFRSTPFDLHVDALFRSHHMHHLPWEPKTLFKVFWTHVCITRCYPRVKTASSNASFLGLHPSECQKYTEKICNPPLAFTHAWAMFPSLPGIENDRPFFCSHNCSQVAVDCHRNSC